MPNTVLYKAGDVVTASMKLAPAHEVPSCIWLLLMLEHAPSDVSSSGGEHRATSLTLQTSPSMSDPTDPGQTAFPLHAVIPKYVVGGTYRATSAIFYMPDGREVHVSAPDPSGVFRRDIADDPPFPFDVPIISNLE